MRVRLAKITLLAAFDAGEPEPLDLESLGDAAAEMVRDFGALTVASAYESAAVDVHEDTEHTDYVADALAARYPEDTLAVGPVPGVKVLGRNGTFKKARLERKDDRIELWLGTEKEQYPLVSFRIQE